jgi:glycosyltransferase involved in cell wall biosynthesis
MRRDIFVSVIVPLENDRDILPTVVPEIDAVMQSHYGDYEIIFIDDGSSDGTRSYFERAKTQVPCFRYFRLTRPFGLEVAIAAGLEQAIGDVIVVLNPACDPPDRIPAFVEKANDTDGIVIGVEPSKPKRSLTYLLAYYLYFAVCKIFLPRAQVYGATHFIALTRTALNALLRIKDSFRYIRVLAMYAGFEVTKVPYEFKQRRNPPRRRKLLPLVAGAGQMIVSNSASTNFFNGVMFGIMFLILAVVCEYLAEMRSEVKRRPLYVVQGELQSNTMLGTAERRNVVSQDVRAEALSAIEPSTAGPPR